MVNLAIGSHLANHHRHSGHSEQAVEMALALAHGHHHELGVPSHRHDATPPATSTLPASLGADLNRIAASQSLSESFFAAAPIALHPIHSPPRSAASPLRL
jgi:hypothetical protein